MKYEELNPVRPSESENGETEDSLHEFKRARVAPDAEHEDGEASASMSPDVDEKAAEG